MWVVKLGGSLYGAACLEDWVARLADAPAPMVVVPGGGPFADQVRAAQQRWRFDDWHAHAMALLAMEQMGLLLCSLNNLLVPCSSVASIRAALADGHVAVWMPSRHVLAQSGLTADWSVTSDSLALWLARDLAARGVLMVKSVDLPDGAATVAQLQRQGVVDDGFARFAQRLRCPVRLVHRSYRGALFRVLGAHTGGALQLETAWVRRADGPAPGLGD